MKSSRLRTDRHRQEWCCCTSYLCVFVSTCRAAHTFFWCKLNTNSKHLSVTQCSLPLFASTCSRATWPLGINRDECQELSSLDVCHFGTTEVYWTKETLTSSVLFVGFASSVNHGVQNKILQLRGCGFKLWLAFKTKCHKQLNECAAGLYLPAAGI